MKPVVVRNIKRADNNAIGTLAGVGVSTAHEALGRSGLMKPYMRPIWAGAQIAGPAVTVLAQPGDNWMIHVAVEQCQKGDVLVVGCTADNSDGMFGELLATALRARGVIGLVIDAGCRDVRPISDMRFPVWSKALSSSRKSSPSIQRKRRKSARTTRTESGSNLRPECSASTCTKCANRLPKRALSTSIGRKTPSQRGV
jgi:regulator of RNase E activity RraA